MQHASPTRPPSVPQHVDMSKLFVPGYLIDMAQKYPQIDWNEVMRYAVAKYRRAGDVIDDGE